MSGNTSPIWLFDCRIGALAPAELYDEILPDHLADTELLWKPIKDRRRQQHRHWDWRAKLADAAGYLFYQGFAVVAEGKTQGLMMVDRSKTARIPVQQGKDLVYIAFLETAPWNLGQQRLYRGVGTALLAAAIQCSLDDGFRGRIGLHSLPQSEDFYRKCSMTEFDRDPDYEDLIYFEMSESRAAEFMREIGS